MRREHPLEGVERDLKVSLRRRLELIEELGADTEALQEELERRGHRPAQARRAALRQIVPTNETLAELETQHAPPLRRWARAAGWLDRVERHCIVVAAMLAGAAACIAMAWSGLLSSTAVLAWPQVIVVALLAANWTRAAKRLWIDGDLRPELRRQLWERQIGLIVAAVALGALGARLGGLQRVGGARSRSLRDASHVGGRPPHRLLRRTRVRCGHLRTLRLARDHPALDQRRDDRAPHLNVLCRFAAHPDLIKPEVTMTFFDSLGLIQYPIWLVLILMLVQIGRATVDQFRPEAPAAGLRIHSILILGALAACLGVLGSLVGVWMAAELISRAGNVSAGLVWSGIQVALGSSIVGFLILGLAAVAWLALQYTAARRQSAI